jgi:8-oxo-dGTP pyrophosphatase MutT (NUDIX family)
MPTNEPLPRPSSTVVLARSGTAAPEIFMVKRHKKSSFGSRYAFPGGVVDACDAQVHASSCGMSASRANSLLGVDAGGLDYFSAAIRELFEESGVLLAQHQLSSKALDAARVALNSSELAWESFAADNAISLQYDRLNYFSFWITPVGLPKRYSARFFLAQVPSAQVATHDGSELTDSCWLPAADILQARKEKLMKVPYPTRKTLKRIAQFDSMSELLQWAKACGDKGVICDQPAFAARSVL